ncbi:MAG: AlpA family phage regulatory protein [Mailhella sp.]|nr:AlpA family phage regulatory protein [Mailhella sp.]
MKQRKTNLSELPKEGFVRLPQILAVIPISKSQFWLGVKNGRFPSPIKLGAKTTAWRVEDIRELIARLSQNTENISADLTAENGE